MLLIYKFVMLCVFNGRMKRKYSTVNELNSDEQFKWLMKRNKNNHNLYADELNETIQIQMLTFQRMNSFETNNKWKAIGREVHGKAGDIKNYKDDNEGIRYPIMRERNLNLIKFVAKIKLNMNNCSRIFLE